MENFGFGAIPSPKDIRDYKLQAAAIIPQNLPKTFKLNMGNIKNQGSQPTCVAHVLASLVEFYNLRDTGYNYNFSTDFIYGCRLDTDYFGEGMYLRDGLKVLQKYGDVWNIQLPGNSNVSVAMEKVKTNFETLIPLAEPNRISTYYKIQTPNEIKYALINDGPVPASMRWFKDAKIDSKGVYNYSSKEIQDHHAVLIIGWTEDSLIIQNSWGRLWGDHGLFYIPFSKIEEVFREFYGVTDDINKIIQPQVITIKLSPIINIVLNLINKIVKAWAGIKLPVT